LHSAAPNGPIGKSEFSADVTSILSSHRIEPSQRTEGRVKSRNAAEHQPRHCSAGLGALLVVTTCGWLAVAAEPARSAQAGGPSVDWDALKQLPDWSGVWAPAPPPPPPKSTVAGPPPGPSAAGGIFGFGVPLKPKYAAMRDERMAAVRGERGRDNIPLSNSGLCLPNGTPSNMGPVAHEYLFSPGRVTILLEDSEIRRIWTDGRPHVPDDEVNPSFSGDSIGHWEGKTLVVDTINIFPEAQLFIGQRVTEKTHVSERIARVGDRIRIDTVVDDPELFTEPWAYTRWYVHEDGPPIDYERCTAGDRVKKGSSTLLDIDFTPPKPEQHK
jgi:hypothetical protein